MVVWGLVVGLSFRAAAFGSWQICFGLKMSGSNSFLMWLVHQCVSDDCAYKFRCN